MSSWTILMCGGGTGGHLFPGIALVEELRRRDDKVRAVFVGTSRGLEAEVVPRLGYQLETLDLTFARGTGLRGWGRALARLPRAGLAALQLVRRHRPALVVSLGGYAAGPVTAVAAVLGIPSVLLEQNTSPGLTTRILARLVKRCFLGFEEAAAQLPRAKCVVTGNPIRADLARAGRLRRQRAHGTWRVLVLGGARGSRPINEHVPALLAALVRHGQVLEIRHQAGRDKAEEVRARYAKHALEAHVVEFLPDILANYREADLVLARAGAGTLAELTALGVPSVLIPFANAADNHQLRNARVMESAGAAIVIEEHQLGDETAQRSIAQLLANPDLLTRMAENAFAQRRTDATERVVDELLRLAAPRESRDLVARAVAMAFAGAVALLTAPVAGIAALLIKLEDRGPILFVQQRVGRDRRPFSVYKLRTMRDGRVTRIGRVLRALSIDELPQLWNVVRGDMSLVGPRPITAADVQRLGWDSPAFDLRFTVRPGITGMVQVVGTAGAARSFELEKMHIAGRSLGLDLELLAVTALMGVLGRERVRALLRWTVRHPVLAAALASRPHATPSRCTAH